MPSMSPRTQALSVAPNATGDQAKSLFDQGLSQMAYNVLISKLPNISQDVVTFKVLETDPEEGSGVGAFVIMRKGQTLYVPVVMAENQIKPLDVLFYKNLNVFLPLSKEWLEELDKMALGDLGRGTNPPSTLQSDVDIRNTVVPPTTGRYTYAADESAERAVKMAALVFDEARNQTEPKLAFLDFLTKAPNNVKLATAKLLETHPSLLKQAVWFYGEQPLVDALARTEEKVADYGYKLAPTGGLYIADKKTLPGEFKDIFGAKAPVAFQGVAVKGYYAKDDRKQVNRALPEQQFFDLQEPKDAGAYRLWMTDGKPVTALLIGNPVNLFHPESSRIPQRNIRFRHNNDAPANPEQGHHSRYRVPGLDGRKDEVHVDRYVGVTEDGKLIDTTHLIGMPVELGHLEGSAVFKKTVGAGIAAGPRVGQTGIFIQRKGASFVATTPVKIEAISNPSEGVRCIEVTQGWLRRSLLTDKNAPVTHFTIPKHSDITYLPGDAVFVPTSGICPPGDLLSNPKDVIRWAQQGIIESGAEKVSVYKPAGVRGYMVDRQELEFVPALRKLATDANISVEDAEFALKQAEESGKFSFWSVNEKSYGKFAAYVKVAEGDAPKKKSSSGGGEQDPAQAAMDQVMAAQMAQPQGPSPVDMAVAEQLQNIQGQMQALTQMQQLVMNIQQRANMIAGGGGAASAPGAAAAAMGGPMDPSMMGAGQPVLGMGQPQQPAQQGMAPQAGQAQQPQPGQQPGMQPQQPGQPGADPSQQQPPPQAMMNADDGSVDSLMGQVNPQFVEQAGQLSDSGAFDAAALASMAQSPALKDMVGAYLPNLEKALDNVGRVLLTLWMDETRIKTDIGNETFIGLEDNLRQVFRGLGDLILKINQNTMVLRDPNEQQFQE